MTDLILRPSGRPEPQHAWSLQLRYHDNLGGTEYVTLVNISEARAREVIESGAPFWLFGEPKS